MRLDKTKISASNSFDNSKEKEYPLSRIPQKRLEQIKRLRRICYGKAAEERMDKTVFEVVQVDWK